MVNHGRGGGHAQLVAEPGERQVARRLALGHRAQHPGPALDLQHALADRLGGQPGRRRIIRLQRRLEAGMAGGDGLRTPADAPLGLAGDEPSSIRRERGHVEERGEERARRAAHAAHHAHACTAALPRLCGPRRSEARRRGLLRGSADVRVMCGVVPRVGLRAGTARYQARYQEGGRDQSNDDGSPFRTPRHPASGHSAKGSTRPVGHIAPGAYARRPEGTWTTEGGHQPATSSASDEGRQRDPAYRDPPTADDHDAAVARCSANGRPPRSHGPRRFR